MLIGCDASRIGLLKHLDDAMCNALGCCVQKNKMKTFAVALVALLAISFSSGEYMSPCWHTSTSFDHGVAHPGDRPG